MHATNAIARGTKKHPVGLTADMEKRLRDSLRQRSPSEPWVEAQFVEIRQTDAHGRATIRRRHDPSVFPPGGDETAMIRCAICGIFTPPNAMEGGICLDHREDGEWGPSASAQAIAALQYRHLRLVDMELEPESASALQEEIREKMGKR